MIKNIKASLMVLCFRESDNYLIHGVGITRDNSKMANIMGKESSHFKMDPGKNICVKEVNFNRMLTLMRPY